MRVVVQVPREGADHAIVLWAHGSGGSAYEPVSRVDPENRVESIRSAVAEEGAAIVNLDLPLLGRRFATVDGGFEDTLVIVDIANLPAFRDNVRQGTVDLWGLLRFAREVLPGLPGEGILDPTRIGAFGHSVGAQIADVALGLFQEAGPSAVLSNGTGGFESHVVLEADLLKLSGEVGELIFQLAGIEAPEEATPREIRGALFGVPEDRWDGIDRHHPLALPFQLVIDGGDPLAVAAEHPVPFTAFRGVGDSRVPPESAAWLADAARNGSLVDCVPRADYDGHVCVFREPEGVAAFRDLVRGL